MNAAGSTSRSRAKRTLRIGIGVAAFAFGVWMLCLHISPRTSFWFTTRWCAFGSWQRGVQLRIGNADQREEYRQALIRAYEGGQSVWPRGAWDVRWPSHGVFDVPIWLIAFPWWWGAAVGLGGGAALLWPWRGGSPGSRRLLAGAAVLAVAAGGAVAGRASADRTLACPLGLVNIASSHGIVYVEAPGWTPSYQVWFADRDVQDHTAVATVNGEVTSSHTLWRWGIGRDQFGRQFRVWGPLVVGEAMLVIGGGWLVQRGWCARRRWANGGCARCGYDMRGLDICPECGSERGASGMLGSCGR